MEFGASVQFKNNTLVVQARSDTSAKTGEGSCYIYKLNTTTNRFAFEYKMWPVSSATGDNFGRATILSAANHYAVASRSNIHFYTPLSTTTENFVRKAGVSIKFDGEMISPLMTGMVAFFPAAKAPLGWLKCNGATLSKADFPELYEVIGDTYGSTATTFNIPDARSSTLVGTDEGRGLDRTRVLGARKTGTIPAGAPLNILAFLACIKY
jgi:phage-related tail fiber protein